MKRLLSTLAPLLLAAGLSSDVAHAWEPATTHAGLTEQSALASSLHKTLRDGFGASQGLYEILTVPKADAPALFAIANRLNPTHGYVPDAAGKMSALSWLVLGSVVADVPAAHAKNHFYSPQTGAGLSDATAHGPGTRAALAVARLGRNPSLEAGGMSAVAWWQSPENPLGYQGFAAQFRKAVSSQTSAERQRHLAGALVAAGAMLHILQDLGSPSHVRDDIRAHQEQIGPSASDRGSRFERIAALGFGRLGIPAAAKVGTFESLSAHFTNADATGLADVTSAGYFSSGTLPDSFRVTRNTGNSAFRERLAKNLKRPEPSAARADGSSTRFDLVAARNASGATWRSSTGVCLAEYRLQNAKVHWSISDDCALEQLEVLLPTVAGYGISFLETLFPGDLAIVASKQTGLPSIALDAKRYGSGQLTAYAEGDDGVRTEFFKKALSGDATVALSAPPQGTTRITVLFDGADAAGKPHLATSTTAWPIR